MKRMTRKGSVVSRAMSKPCAFYSPFSEILTRRLLAPTRTTVLQEIIEDECVKGVPSSDFDEDFVVKHVLSLVLRYEPSRNAILDSLRGADGLRGFLGGIPFQKPDERTNLPWWEKNEWQFPK